VENNLEKLWQYAALISRQNADYCNEHVSGHCLQNNIIAESKEVARKKDNYHFFFSDLSRPALKNLED